MQAFRIALAAGVAIVLVLGAFRLFPVGLVAAALLLPIVSVMYLYDVDVYEDQPALVLGLTMVWGAIAGAGLTLLMATVAPIDAATIANDDASTVVDRAVLFPLISVPLMLAGPLVLLPYKRFNDVLDGTTFGVASAAAFVSVVTLAQGFEYLGEGLRPDGLIVPWLVRLAVVAIAVPVLTTASIGAAAGTFWLRYRAPVRDRAKLGPLGQPLVAVPLAAILLVTADVFEALLPGGLTLALQLVLGAFGLIWLRHVIQVGLLEEAAEIEIGPEIECANCGTRTPSHTFCSNCGISLRALPKARAPGAPSPPPAAAEAPA
jgi:hypothetical protein